MKLKRNPNYELRDTEFKRPYVDSVELPIVPDSANQLAQFRVGAIMMPTRGWSHRCRRLVPSRTCCS